MIFVLLKESAGEDAVHVPVRVKGVQRTVDLVVSGLKRREDHEVVIEG